MSHLAFEVCSLSTVILLLTHYHYFPSRKFKSVILVVQLLMLHLIPVELLWWELNLTRAAGRVTPDRVIPSASGGDVNLRDLRSRSGKQGVDLYYY